MKYIEVLFVFLIPITLIAWSTIDLLFLRSTAPILTYQVDVINLDEARILRTYTTLNNTIDQLKTIQNNLIAKVMSLEISNQTIEDKIRVVSK
jgi:hypothetical protein